MVYKRRGSRMYWYRFNWNGRRIRQSARTENKEAAKGIEAAHRVRLAKGEAGIVTRRTAPTVAEFSKSFLSECIARHGEAKTARFYGQQVAYLLADPVIASSRLDGITRETVATYAVRRRKQVSIATTNRQLATLRRMLHLAAEWNIIGAAPRVKLLPGEQPREYVLPRGDIEADYIEAMPELGGRIARLLLETGLRISEALKLRWSDISAPTPDAVGYLRVRRENSKSGRPRAVPLTVMAWEALHEGCRFDDFVFGAPPPHISTVEHWHSHARARLGLPEEFVLHSLRHTMLTRLGEAGADAFTIMRVAGHASVVTSQRYVHPVPETVERAIARAETLGTELATAAKAPKPKKLILLPSARRAKG